VIGNRLQVGRGFGNEYVLGLTTIDGVAEPPAAHRLASALGLIFVEASMALPRRRDRTGDHALTDLVARNRFPEFLYDTHRLMAYGKPARNWIITLENVHVGTADGGCRHSSRTAALIVRLRWPRLRRSELRHSSSSGWVLATRPLDGDDDPVAPDPQAWR